MHLPSTNTNNSTSCNSRKSKQTSFQYYAVKHVKCSIFASSYLGSSNLLYIRFKKIPYNRKTYIECHKYQRRDSQGVHDFENKNWYEGNRYEFKNLEEIDRGDRVSNRDPLSTCHHFKGEILWAWQKQCIEDILGWCTWDASSI